MGKQRTEQTHEKMKKFVKIYEVIVVSLDVLWMVKICGANGENILEMLFSINIFSRSFPAINLKFQHSSIEMESQVSHIRKNIFIIE